MDTTTPRIVESQGRHRSSLYRAAKAGRLERVGRGIYRDPRAQPADFDWIEAAARREDATICLTSALAHHDLTDDIPDALDVALPRGSRKPSSTGAIRWHTFDAATFDVGRERTQVPGSDLVIGIYGPERSIADAFRLRGDLGYELAQDALRTWLRGGGKPADLLRVAALLPRAEGPLRQSLEVLA